MQPVQGRPGAGLSGFCVRGSPAVRLSGNTSNQTDVHGTKACDPPIMPGTSTAGTTDGGKDDKQDSLYQAGFHEQSNTAARIDTLSKQRHSTVRKGATAISDASKHRQQQAGSSVGMTIVAISRPQSNSQHSGAPQLVKPKATPSINKQQAHTIHRQDSKRKNDTKTSARNSTNAKPAAANESGTNVQHTVDISAPTVLLGESNKTAALSQQPIPDQEKVDEVVASTCVGNTQGSSSLTLQHATHSQLQPEPSTGSVNHQTGEGDSQQGGDVPEVQCMQTMIGQDLGVTLVRNGDAQGMPAQHHNQMPGIGCDLQYNHGHGKAALSRIPDAPQLDGRCFRFIRKLGAGSFATVFLARQLTSPTADASTNTGRRVVVKRLDRMDTDIDEVCNEIQVMQRAGAHPNLVQFHGWYSDPIDGCISLVMSYCEGGTMSALLKGRPNDPLATQPAAFYPETLIMCWFVQLVLALDHLHSKQILHRDLKPDNIFLTKNCKVVCLGDLGIAKQLEGSLELAITVLGTPYYMSPEVVCGRPYTYASDVWALGCVLYEMAARRPAFEAHGLPQLMFKIMRTSYDPLPPAFSRPFQQLVTRLLRADPGDRPSTQEILQLPVVRKQVMQMLGSANKDGNAVDAISSKLVSSMMNRKSKPKTSARTPATQNLSTAAPCDSRSDNVTPITVEKIDPPLQEGNTAVADDQQAVTPDDGMTTDAPQAGLQDVADLAIAEQDISQQVEKDVAQKKQKARKKRERQHAAFHTFLAAVVPDVLLERHGKGGSLRMWDSGAHYDAKLSQQAEQRFRARELEQRITREQVRALRRERDPSHQQHEAQMNELQEAMLEQRRRHKVATGQKQLLVDLLGEEDAQAGTLAAFIPRDRLPRTPGASLPNQVQVDMADPDDDDFVLMGTIHVPHVTDHPDSAEPDSIDGMLAQHLPVPEEMPLMHEPQHEEQTQDSLLPNSCSHDGVDGPLGFEPHSDMVENQNPSDHMTTGEQQEPNTDVNEDSIDSECSEDCTDENEHSHSSDEEEDDSQSLDAYTLPSENDEEMDEDPAQRMESTMQSSGQEYKAKDSDIDAGCFGNTTPGSVEQRDLSCNPDITEQRRDGMDGEDNDCRQAAEAQERGEQESNAACEAGSVNLAQSMPTQSNQSWSQRNEAKQLTRSLQCLEKQLTDLWTGSDDGEVRTVLGRVWQLTLQEQAVRYSQTLNTGNQIAVPHSKRPMSAYAASSAHTVQPGVAAEKQDIIAHQEYDQSSADLHSGAHDAPAPSVSQGETRPDTVFKQRPVSSPSVTIHQHAAIHMQRVATVASGQFDPDSKVLYAAEEDKQGVATIKMRPSAQADDVLLKLPALQVGSTDSSDEHMASLPGQLQPSRQCAQHLPSQSSRFKAVPFLMSRHLNAQPRAAYSAGQAYPSAMAKPSHPWRIQSDNEHADVAMPDDAVLLTAEATSTQQECSQLPHVAQVMPDSAANDFDTTQLPDISMTQLQSQIAHMKQWHATHRKRQG